MPTTPSNSAGPRCPRCDTLIVWSGNPARPFCSLRCKLIDLGRWLDEEYRVPADADPTDRDMPPDAS